MKKISLLIIVSVFASIGFAQQFPLQSQYQFNYPTINPAASGENVFYRARASFREQWVGLTENPISTQILTVTKGFGNNGLGITFFSDKTGGAFNKSGGALSYSHRVQVNKSQIAFGVSAGA
jgi:type IX secretion system PorP/SprF family membrane protein